MIKTKDKLLDEKIISAYSELPTCITIHPGDISEKTGLDEEIVAERLKTLLIEGKIKPKFTVTCSEGCFYTIADEFIVEDGIWCNLLNKRVEYNVMKVSPECPIKNKTLYVEIIASE